MKIDARILCLNTRLLTGCTMPSLTEAPRQPVTLRAVNEHEMEVCFSNILGIVKVNIENLTGESVYSTQADTAITRSLLINSMNKGRYIINITTVSRCFTGGFEL